MTFRIAVEPGSLTDGDSLVLVNASNTNAQLGSGVSGAIRAACGKGYQRFILDELQRVYGGPMAPGQALLTNAGSHPRARYVVHLAVMDYREGFTAASMPRLATIEACATALWPLLEGLPEPEVSVAMVALGAGTGNLGVVEPVRIIARSLLAHVAATPTTRLGCVTFYGFSLPEYVAVARTLVELVPSLRDTLPAELRAALL